MKVFYQNYPEKMTDDVVYYVEFRKWENENFSTWTLFKRNFIMSEEEFKKEKKRHKKYAFLISNEGHPYNLCSGDVNANDSAVDINTKSFLIFMVDALNEKCARAKKKKTH